MLFLPVSFHVSRYRSGKRKFHPNRSKSANWTLHLMKGDRQRISDRGHKRERQILDEHLGDFTPDGSRGMAFIQRLSPCGSLTRVSLVFLAHVFSVVTEVPFHRDFTRRRNLVIKWFDDHIDELEPFGSLFTLEAANHGMKSEDVSALAESLDEDSILDF